MRANESSAEHTSDAARARSLSAAARKKDTAAVAAPAGHDSVESPHALPALQRSAGNAAVAQLLQRRQGPGGGAGPGHSVQRHPLTVQRMGNTQSSGTGSGEGVELEDTPK